MCGGACASVCVHSVRQLPSCAAPTPPFVFDVECSGKRHMRGTTDTPARRPSVSVPTQNYRPAHTRERGRRARRTGDNGCELGRPRHVFAGRGKKADEGNILAAPAEGRTIKQTAERMDAPGRGGRTRRQRQVWRRGARGEDEGCAGGRRGARVRLVPVLSGQPLGCRCWCAAGPWGAQRGCHRVAARPPSSSRDQAA